LQPFHRAPLTRRWNASARATRLVGNKPCARLRSVWPARKGGQDCLPAPVWANLDNIQFEDEPTEQMTQLILVPGNYHDVLLVDHFQLEVPAAATILGITVEVHRAGDDGVADESVRIVKGGRVGESDRYRKSGAGT